MLWAGKVSLDTLKASVQSWNGGTGFDTNDPTLGVRDVKGNGTYLLVSGYGPTGYAVFTFTGNGGWENNSSLSQAESDYVSGNNEETNPGDEEGEGGKPPDFGPTGPVYTPLDPAGIPERNYTNFYPQSYMPADPAYPTMGLLSNPATQPGLQGTDLYQPWSAKYGQNVAPASLWNYQPPSGLDVAAGPKVTFQK